VIDFVGVKTDADSRPTILPVFDLYVHRTLHCSLFSRLSSFGGNTYSMLSYRNFSIRNNPSLPFKFHLFEFPVLHRETLGFTDTLIAA
jgi:hypothetical protein